MSSFIIIMSAMEAERERKRKSKKKKKFEKEMLAQGYVKERKLANPNFCYTHIFRSLRKQTIGLILMFVFLCILTTMINLAIHVFHMWQFWLGFISTIGVVIGLFNVFNNEYEINGSKEPPQKPGYKYLQTIHEPRYGWEWIKKEEK